MISTQTGASMSRPSGHHLGAGSAAVPTNLPAADPSSTHTPLFEDLPDVWPSGSGEPRLLEACSTACQDATSQLEPVRCASVTALFEARPVTVAVTELRALLLDHAQYREEEGPALEAGGSRARGGVRAGPRPPRGGRVRRGA